MDILLSPDALNLCGSIKHFVISSATEISFILKDKSTGNSIVEHTYAPSSTGRIEVDVKDIIFPLLSFKLRNVSEPYRQSDIVKTFEVFIQEVSSSGASGNPYHKEFTAIRSGVDEFSETAESFFKQNFLTWQPNVKPVTYYSPEFLTYYAVVPVTVKCKVHLDSEDKELVLAQFGEGECWTVPVQYAIIAGKVASLPLYYDIWAENEAGDRLTYIQRYYADDMRSDAEEWILFENSLGGIDTFRAYGDSENTAEHTHNVAQIEEISEEYRVDTTRKFKKNTGFLDRKERVWLLDFFPSLAKYIYVASHLRRIVVTDSDVSYHVRELPSSYNFTYKYADAQPYLNIPRIDKPQEVLSIKVPDVGSFTIAPRLAEFPTLALSEGALFPTQDPYSGSWNTTTAGDLVSFIVKVIVAAYKGDGTIGHTHSNMSVLESLSFLGDYLLKNAKKISAGFADRAEKADMLSEKSREWAKILRKDVPNAALKLIAFWEGIEFGREGKHSINGNGIADLAGAIVSEFLKSSNFNASSQRGFGIESDGSGGYRLSIKDLLVWGKATFQNLELRTMSYVAGNYRISGAGSKIAYVQWLDKDGHVTEDVLQIENFRCFILADDGTMATRNFWEVDDQARAEEFNIKPGVYADVANRQYWRKVTAVSANNVQIKNGKGVDLFPGKKFAWIDLSRKDCTDMIRKADDIIRDDFPKTGDSIVQSGNRTKPSRQGFIDINSTGEHGASIVIYKNVSSYSLEGKVVGNMSKDGFLFESRFFRLITSSGTVPLPVDLGAWYMGMKCEYYNRVSHDGSLWLCVAPEGTIVTSEPKEGDPQWQKQVSRGGKGDKGDAAVELHLDVVRGDTFYREGQGFVAELEATVIQGGKDLTPTLHASQLVWTRESEDTAGDEEWNARHRSIGNRITVSADDLTDNTAVVFTLYDEHGIASKLKGRMAFRQTPKDGVPGMTLQLIPDRLVLSTDDDGIVKDFSGASCLVQLVRGTTVLAPAVVKVQQVNCAAQVTNNTVKITGISVDPATNYSFGSGYVDLSATVDGQTLKGRLNVEVNIHRAVAKLEKSNKGIVAEVDTLDKKVNSHKESIAKLAVRQGEIDLSVKEYTPQRNLLRGTSFRFVSEIPQNSKEHPATLSPDTYKGTGVVDINVNESENVYSGIYYARIRGVAGKRLTLSFMTKTITKPDAMGAEVKAYKSDWEPSDIKFRLAEYYIPENNEWQLHSITFDVPGDTEHLDIPIYIAKSGHALIARPMLEESSEYRGWTPSPLDDIDAVKRCGVNVNAERIELDGKSVFKNGHAPEVPLFDEKGKINPNLSAAQYLMEVLKSMETVIDGGLVMAGLIAAKDAGGNVTAYLNGLRQKMYALAAGVKNFGKDNETSLSHIGFDGSAQFGNLGIAYDGRVSIIDEAGKPRINVTPKGLPSDGELLKTADTDITQPLPEMAVKPTNWQPEITGGTFTVANDNSDVTLTGELIVNARVNSGLPDGVSATSPLPVLLLRNRHSGAEVYLGQWSLRSVVISDGEPNGISDRKDILITRILSVGTWTLVMQSYHGGNVHEESIFLTSLQVNISHKSGAQALSLARNGWSVVQSEKQAAYVRDGKLCAVGAMNIPGILLAGTVNRLGQLSNAWGEFAPGTSLQYTSYGGVQVMRLTFRDPLPCGANYVAIVNPNDDTSPYGCMPVVRHKTANYCDFRVVNDSGGEVSNVGLDFMIIGRNK